MVQGRVGALHLRSGRFDLLLIAIYYPLVPVKQADEEAYIKITNCIQKWLADLLADLNGRTSIFIGLDNCKFGTPREDALQTEVDPVGPLNPKKEGSLATTLRPLLAQYHLAVVSSREERTLSSAI
jgi:hypothetical protein